MRQWQPNDLFWIVGNGFKYTGMPTGSRSSARTRFGPSSHFSLRSKNSTRRLIGISRSAMSICPKQAVPSLRHSSPSPGRLRLAPGATAMKANGRRATSCGSCTASRPIISSPRSRPVPKANGEAESCNHWRRISPRRICVSSRTIMRVLPTRRCRQPAQTRPSWSGGGNWSSKVCQARTYHLRDMPQQCRALNRAALVPPQHHDGADDEERSDQKSGEGTAEPGAESLARSLGEVIGHMRPYLDCGCAYGIVLRP